MRRLTAGQLTHDGRPMVVAEPVMILPARAAPYLLELMDRYARADGVRVRDGLPADVRTVLEEASRHALSGHPDVRLEARPLDSGTWIGSRRVAEMLAVDQRHARRLIAEEAFGDYLQKGNRKLARKGAVVAYISGRGAA